jgi:glycosyltransferase involved in cell wall biosynthesis
MRKKQQAQRKPVYGVVIPAYQEEKKIAEVVKAALKYCDRVFVVDDGSSDQTAHCADQAGARVVKHAVNQGKGVALQSGFKAAQEMGCEAVITLDADGQHDPAEIPRFMEAYERTGIPVLVGNRMANSEGMPLIRRWTNRYMSWMLSRAMRQYVPDTQCGYRLYRCDIIPFVATNSERFAAESEILLHIAMRGIRMDSVHISTIYSNEKSKISPIMDTVRFFSMIHRFHKHVRHGQRRVY